MSRDKNIILVCGYPKSGTTWLSRLVADMLEAPFVGDWGYESVNRSGMNQDKTDSPYRVYKSHHLAEELKQDRPWKILHIIRDPRDVVVSGAHFFEMPTLLMGSSGLVKQMDRLLSKAVPAKVLMEQKQNRMIEAVLNGDPGITPWMTYSWMEHKLSFDSLTCQQIYYEKLLDRPLESLKEIVGFFDIELSDNLLLEAFQRQNFETRKQEVANEHPNVQKLVRLGVAGSFKTELSRNQLDRLAPLMEDPRNPYSNANYL